MLLFSKSNRIIIGYLHPEKILLDNENKWFAGPCFRRLSTPPRRCYHTCLNQVCALYCSNTCLCFQDYINYYWDTSALTMLLLSVADKTRSKTWATVEGWNPRRPTSSEKAVKPLLYPAKAESNRGVEIMHGKTIWVCKNKSPANSLRMESPLVVHSRKRCAT